MSTRKILSAFPRMTEREASCAVLIAEGLSNQDIAERLGIAAKTVKNVNMAVSLKMDVEPGGSVRVRVARKVWALDHPAE